LIKYINLLILLFLLIIWNYIYLNANRIVYELAQRAIHFKILKNININIITNSQKIIFHQSYSEGAWAFTIGIFFYKCLVLIANTYLNLY
jgi:hypothetical protein